jgi:hypothetical protein
LSQISSSQNQQRIIEVLCLTIVSYLNVIEQELFALINLFLNLSPQFFISKFLQLSFSIMLIRQSNCLKLFAVNFFVEMESYKLSLHSKNFPFKICCIDEWTDHFILNFIMRTRLIAVAITALKLLVSVIEYMV